MLCVLAVIDCTGRGKNKFSLVLTTTHDLIVWTTRLFVPVRHCARFVRVLAIDATRQTTIRVIILHDPI